MHAEIAALLVAGSRAYGATVYVARVRKDGTPADSKPCKKCEGQLKRKGVKKVIWT
jgi:deoxycytidylate deaminase